MNDITIDGPSGPISRNQRIAERLSQIPERQRRAYIKAVERKSMAAACKSFCYECVGYVWEEVRLCTDPACPLWAYRPGYSVSTEAKIEQFRDLGSTIGA